MCLRRPGGLFSRKLSPWTPYKSFSLKFFLGASLCIFVAILKLSFYEFRMIPGNDDGYFAFYFFPGKMLVELFQETPPDFFVHFG